MCVHCNACYNKGWSAGDKESRKSSRINHVIVVIWAPPAWAYIYQGGRSIQLSAQNPDNAQIYVGQGAPWQLWLRYSWRGVGGGALQIEPATLNRHNIAIGHVFLNLVSYQGQQPVTDTIKQLVTCLRLSMHSHWMQLLNVSQCKLSSKSPVKLQIPMTELERH